MPDEIIDDCILKFEEEGIFTMEHVILSKTILTDVKLDSMGIKAGPVGLIIKELKKMPSGTDFS
jgi:hypothetical protein